MLKSISKSITVSRKMTFEKKLSLFLTLIFLFSIIIGGFYNYFLYNHLLKIDIFNFITTYDLIFSWISNEKLIIDFLIVSFVFIFMLNSNDSKEYAKYFKIKYLYIFVPICFFSYFLLLFFYYIYNIGFLYYFIAKLLLLLLILSLTLILVIKVQELFLFHLTIIIIMFISLFISLKQNTFYLYDDLEFDLYLNSYNVNLIRGNNIDNCKFNYQLIGTTTSNSIFLVTDISNFFVDNNSNTINYEAILGHTEKDKRIEILNNNNISRMKHINIDYFKNIKDKNRDKNKERKDIDRINHLYKDCINN